MARAPTPLPGPPPRRSPDGASRDLLTDRVIAAIGDQYDVEGEVGRGGMAVVYRARDVRLRRLVAVKVLPPELAYRAEVRTRFLREAEMAAQLRHPNIVPIYAVDERGGIVYIVMALVQGESLAARLARDPRPPVETVRTVLAEVADALAYAHARGVVHRDVKPDNILLDREAGGRAMVTDYGIARAAEGDERMTVTGVAIGTPAYMSPEQALGERDVDGRSDVYSLGLVGYQMLAGEPAFTAANTPAMLMKQLSEQPRALGPRRPDVAPGLVHVIERALRKERSERWADAGAMRDALADEAPLRARTSDGGGGGGDPAGTRHSSAAPPSREASRPRAPQEQSAAVLERGARPAWMPPPLDMPPTPMVPRGSARDAMPTAGSWSSDAGVGDSGAADSRRPPAARIRRFRRHFARYVATISMLAGINLLTNPGFLWFLFPALGMLVPLVMEAGSLWGDGLGAQLLFGSIGDAPAALPSASRAAVDASWVGRRVQALRHQTASALGFGVGGLSLFLFGASIDVGLIATLGGISMAIGIINFAFALRHGAAVSNARVPIHAALSARWREAVEAVLPRSAAPAASVSQRALTRLASPDLLAGTHGATVNRAAEDEQAILETLARLPEGDRALIPDVAPTVRSLLERIVSLATSLHRLEADVTPEAMTKLEARIAAAEQEHVDAPDRERRRALLERQRSTLRDLAARRDTLAGQLESAALMLQSVRLDLLKLRSAGVHGALDDLDSATREARALSRELGYVIDAADELRRDR